MTVELSRKWRALLCLAILVFLSLPQLARAEALLVNGGFETGDFTGWTVSDRAGGSGSFFICSGAANGLCVIDLGSGQVPATPLSINPSAGPAGGSFYVVSDQLGGGTHALAQTFSVPGTAGSVTLSFDMFVNDWSSFVGSGPAVDPAGLDHNAVPNQHARVDILSTGAGVFDTGAAVLRNFYLGVDANPGENPYTSYLFDITDVVGGGGTFVLRFAEVDNQFFLNQGIDNVRVDFQSVAVPEPTTLFLLAAGLAGLGFARRKHPPKRSI